MDYGSPEFVGSRWSKLPLDLMQSVFERLGFADFQRAKSVCSSWHYASKQSSPNNQIPWLILFPGKGKDYCHLFNIEEQDKLHRVQDLGANFANSNCLTTCGSWLLMQDPMYNLYMLNIFTRERIDLPSMKSQLRGIETEQTEDETFLVRFNKENRDVSFWIDEKTKDYVVVWIIQDPFKVLVYSRKGDKFWKQIEKQIEPFTYNSDMVYKDHKLYLYSISRDVKVLDFSEDIPRQIFETRLDERFKDDNRLFNPGMARWTTKTEHLVVRVTGEVLRVKSIIWDHSDVWSFRIYKMNSSNSKWEKITSLGDEAILLDLGITVLANTIAGVDGNSIYFSSNHSYHGSQKEILIFNLSTHEVERPHQSICSSIRLSNARWFVPNFKTK